MKAAFVYDDALSRHVLREDHPLRPYRLRLTAELLDAYGAFQHPDVLLVPPRHATREELLLVHDPDYVDAVARISEGDSEVNPARYNFSEQGDNPPFLGMYEASTLSTGASLVAAELVLDGQAQVAFSISGGLHHAARARASGFCIFNDPAVIIARMVRQGLRVAYVDIDAHHGDGVQDAFYTTDRVLTISFHESGRYLFPGTGEAADIGSGSGRGYAVNLPLAPYTGDDVYQEAFEQVVPPLVAAFAPDVLVLQLGVDAYFNDPLAHLQLTTDTYSNVVRRLLGLCARVVALGGGGYDPAAVARIWTLDFGWMLDIEWSDDVPDGYRAAYGIERLRDAGRPGVAAAREAQSREFAQAGVATLQRLVFPIHGLKL